MALNSNTNEPLLLIILNNIYCLFFQYFVTYLYFDHESCTINTLVLTMVKSDLENIEEKEETIGYQHILLYTFSNLSLTNLSFDPFPNKPCFLHVCSTSLLKTMREKEKLLVMSYFSFSHSVFYPFEELFFHFHQT